MKLRVTTHSSRTERRQELRRTEPYMVCGAPAPLLTPIAVSKTTRHLTLAAAQIASCHVGGGSLTKDTKHRRRNVAQRATRLKRSGSIIAHENERHRIQRVVGMRTARHGIDHRLGV